MGILVNLYGAVNTLGLQDNTRYDNLAEIFQKTDSFDPFLFEKLKQVVNCELPPTNLEEQKIIDIFGRQMIEEIEMLCVSKKIRRHSSEH